jgi:tricorn protease interacting factor F2/3
VGGGLLEYDLALEIDYPTNSYLGTVRTTGLTESWPLALDSKGLTIVAVHVGDAEVPFELDEKAGKLRLGLEITPSATVQIDFAGKAPEDVQTGFFVCHLGPEKALTTQMEPESCRRLFPCLDRPDRKAVFRLRVAARSDLVVISNMPGESGPPNEGRRTWTFAPTPPMSSYLFYLGVGPFEETVDETGPTRVVVAAPAGNRSRAERTARIARTVLRGYTEYFDIPYPLPKLHLVALTGFWAAMENWGAVSGSEEHYLMDETASPVALQYADQSIVHEIGHQWFGDLVTLESWDELWLNEAFTTFVVPVVQEITHLRQDPWAEFVMWTQRGSRADSVWATHPVKPDSADPEEIMARADAITYFKGARLIRMIEAFVGHDSFRDGITEYLRDHEFGNARSDDLWAALEEESGTPVARVMRAWVERPGHPCVAVHQTGPDVELRQHRFTLLPGPRNDPPWPIPLAWTDGDASGSVVFDSRTTVLAGRDATTLVVDPGRTGFFRILWPRELRARRTQDLAQLPPSDRWGFVHDAFLFLLSGDYALDELLAVLDAVTLTTDRLTVEELGQSLDALLPVLSDVPTFAHAVRELCRLQTERLGERSVPKEPEGWDGVRDWIFCARVRIDEEYARSLAPRFARIESEPPALQQAIACAFARLGGPTAVERLLEMARGANADLASTACNALGDVPDVDALLRALDDAFTSVRPTALYIYLIPSCARNPAVRSALWEWLTRHLRELERRGSGSFLLSELFDRTLPYVGIGHVEIVKQYFEREIFPQGQVGVRRGLELLEVHERLRARVRDGRGD